MKTFIKTLTLSLGFAVVVATANAQTEPAKGVRLSVGADAGLPVGDFNKAYDWSLGGSLQADFPVASQLYVTLNAGYNNFFVKDGILLTKDLQLIPVKAGLKYFPVKSFYLQGEAGTAFLANKKDIGATNSASFVYAPQVGYLIGLGGSNYLDAGVRFESNSKFYNNGKSNNFFGLRVAYAFAL
jgi:hypothetical protein